MYGTRIVVLGAGVVGSACARELATDGFEVVVVDRAHPGGATTAHGEGNVLVSDKDDGPELRLAQLSRRLWPEVLAELDADVEWDPKGGIVVATSEAGAAELAAFAKGQRAAGVQAEPLDAGTLADRRRIEGAAPFLHR